MDPFRGLVMDGCDARRAGRIHASLSHRHAAQVVNVRHRPDAFTVDFNAACAGSSTHHPRLDAPPAYGGSGSAGRVTTLTREDAHGPLHFAGEPRSMPFGARVP
jgi:hypothetical protein